MAPPNTRPVPSVDTPDVRLASDSPEFPKSCAFPFVYRNTSGRYGPPSNGAPSGPFGEYRA